tara:strand:- start:1787 stop:2044 length:258 start_codon:yes stop_codon:yes gene_type:complete
MTDEIRTQVTVKGVRDPVLYDYLSQFPIKDRAYNMTKLMTLGLLVERGGIPSPSSRIAPSEITEQAVANDSSQDLMLGAGLSDLF